MSPPRIETARLRLSPLSHEDLEQLQNLWTRPGVRQYLFDEEIVDRERVRAEIAASLTRFENHGAGLWAAFPKGEDTLIGFCGFRPFHDPPELQLLYGITPDRWGEGLATECAVAMIRYGFEEQGLDCIRGSADSPNVASLRVMEKAGMSFEKRVVINGRDTVYYAINRQAYRPTAAPYTLHR